MTETPNPTPSEIIATNVDPHQVSCICVIVQGLLASGHFTIPPNPDAGELDDDKFPQIPSVDTGNPDDPHFVSGVVLEAMGLYDEVVESVRRGI